ncbi:MAG TPA: hypothetical protein VFN67_35270 [Polyangiales bacterium]|nr:hypothetical protein [Polyangiales bacterium]
MATTGPVLLTVLGAALIVGGIALSMHTEDQEGCPSDLPVEVPRAPDGPVVGLGNLRDDPSKCGAHPYTVPGATMLLVGAAGVVGGVGLMFSRMSEARRQSELQRIDANLKEHGVQLAVTPWLNPSPNVGISYGLRAAGTF